MLFSGVIDKMKSINIFRHLSKSELTLWIFSVFLIVFSFIFCKSDDLLTLIASLIGVTALIFVAKGFVIGQVLTIAFSVFYGIISLYFGYYGEMITYLCMTSPIALFTAISWARHPYKGTKEVTVKKLCKNEILVLIILSVVITAIFYYILKALNNTNLFFSTVSVTTSFVACGLTFMRSPYYALGYAANDIILIILWSLATRENHSYFPMIVCFVMFLLNDLYGFYNWLKMRKRQIKTA